MTYGEDEAETSGWPLSGSPGKRLHASDPLTEHDVAERLDKAALRVVRIMSDARQQGYMDAVKHSRYLTGALNLLAAELDLWDARPQEGYERDYPANPDRGAES